MTPVGFDSWEEFSKFALAREFVDSHGETLSLPTSSLEKVGHSLASLLLKPLDLVLTQIRNPAVIAALTVASLLVVAVIFYPVQTMLIVTLALPFLKAVQARHVKMGFYLFSQTIILGLGLRTLGRLSNPDLMAAFHQKEIFPIPLGAIRLEN